MSKCKCKWCGEEFIKNHNREMYCSDYCRKAALREQWAVNSYNYRNRYKNQLNYKKQVKVGTGCLGAHRLSDFDKEYQKISREMKRLRVR